MLNLSRKVDGHAIMFYNLPKIFSNIFHDSPTGMIRLNNGRLVYWKLDKNISNLKKLKNTRDLCSKLADAMFDIIKSEEFGVEYGTNGLDNYYDNINNFRFAFKKALDSNTKQVEYTSSENFKTKKITEAIRFNLVNDIVFTATKNFKPVYMSKGIRGKLWLGEDKNDFFYFNIHSPSFVIEDYVAPIVITKLVVGKLRTNMPNLLGNARFELDGYEDTRPREKKQEHHTLRDLEEKFGHKNNRRKEKYVKEETDVEQVKNHLKETIQEANKELLVLSKELFDALTDDDKNGYLDTVISWFDLDNEDHLIVQALTSGMLSEEYVQYYVNEDNQDEEQLPLPEWIGIKFLNQDEERVKALFKVETFQEE